MSPVEHEQPSTPGFYRTVKSREILIDAQSETVDVKIDGHSLVSRAHTDLIHGLKCDIVSRYHVYQYHVRPGGHGPDPLPRYRIGDELRSFDTLTVRRIGQADPVRWPSESENSRTVDITISTEPV